MHVGLKVNALFLQVMTVQVYKDIIHIVASCQDVKLHKLCHGSIVPGHTIINGCTLLMDSGSEGKYVKEHP